MLLKGFLQVPRPRIKNKLSVLPKFKIICEGEKTEPNYINGYINRVHSAHKKIFCFSEPGCTDPNGLIRAAIKERESGVAGDVVWVIYDRESLVKYSDEVHASARTLADDNNIQIAFSNVCFEMWILLHFEYSLACYTSYDDLKKRSRLREHVKSLGFDSYEKSEALLFDKLKDNVSDAIKNATKLRQNMIASADKNRSRPFHLNPYTDVDEMLQDMENFIENRPSIRAKKQV
ncbi:hypothetical protein JAMGFMIE_01274 [Rheinheimera sp. MM224]|nr:hypothetical protein JAMGFMIE_01274 [Rheinheimera sp. MM224]